MPFKTVQLAGMNKSSKRKSDRDKRAARKRARKNFLPTLIVILILWTSIGILIYSVDPQKLGAIPVFFILVFLTLFFTLSTLLVNAKRGLLVAISLVLYLVLSYIGLGNALNLAFLFGIAATLDIYFSKSNEKPKKKRDKYVAPKRSSSLATKRSSFIAKKFVKKILESREKDF